MTGQDPWNNIDDGKPYNPPEDDSVMSPGDLDIDLNTGKEPAEPLDISLNPVPPEPVDSTYMVDKQEAPETYTRPPAPEPVSPPPRSKRVIRKKKVSLNNTQPMRFVFGDMAGAVFLVWLPVLIAFAVPWGNFFGDVTVYGTLKLTHLIVAGIIALPPWIVLMLHLFRGRLWDGILDMFLWAIWECAAVIILAFLYPEQTKQLIWQAGSYFEEMSGWLRTGTGSEADPSAWIWIHLKWLGLVVLGGFLLGLPALIMGVLLLNFMNYYVAQIMLTSESPLVVMMVAWHIWSIARVAGFIILASTMFQLLIGWVFKAPMRTAHVVWGLIVGFILVVADAVMKWQLVDNVRDIINHLANI